MIWASVTQTSPCCKQTGHETKHGMIMSQRDALYPNIWLLFSSSNSKFTNEQSNIWLFVGALVLTEIICYKCVIRLILFLLQTETHQHIPAKRLAAGQHDAGEFLSDPETPEEEIKNMFGGNYCTLRILQFSKVLIFFVEKLLDKWTYGMKNCWSTIIVRRTFN